VNRYDTSTAHLARAEAVIPLGSQTFSKSRTQWPVGAAPLYAERAKGGRLWDVDGNEYVDLVSALGCVSLGYGDPEVDAAVVEQLAHGVSLSLPTRLEAQVAERLVDLIPCAEAVRFAKNGTDVTTAAIRLARAFTGRDRVIALGYHGWADWYIGATTRDLGVPAATAALTSKVPYGDLDALAEALDSWDVAAVILEPMNGQWPARGYLEAVREITSYYDTLLVFDEMLTGFRVAPGGAQELFGVTPDLATFGKAIANGLPLAALVGRADIMGLLTEVFFSGTYGGEALSLAAASVVIGRAEASTSAMFDVGLDLSVRVQRIIEETGAPLRLSGHPAWQHLTWDAPDVDAVKTLFVQEMARHGVLVLGTHTVSAAHTEADLDVVEAAYRAALTTIAEGLAADDVADRLKCEPLRPLFAVR
jgi:glutamate-1-semialdehyde 2,1-aminomutase